jgi:hypothetical protein
MEAKFITKPKPGKYPKFTKNVSPICLSSETGKLFERVLLKTVQRHTEGSSMRFLDHGCSILGYRKSL